MSAQVSNTDSKITNTPFEASKQRSPGQDAAARKYRKIEEEELYLIFLDSETSGLSPDKTHMLEIAFKIVNAFTGEEKGGFEHILKLPETDFEHWSGKPSEWEKEHARALEVNGFTWKKMETGSYPSEVAEKICKLFGELGVNKYNAQFYCQNPSFDRGFFERVVTEKQRNDAKIPYHWFDLASADHAFQMKEIQERGKRPEKKIYYSKDAIAERHGLGPEEKPHGAMNGVNHLIECYKKVVGFPLINKKAKINHNLTRNQ